MFADNMKLYQPVKNQTDVKSLQGDVSLAIDWSIKCQFRFNTRNCKVLLVGRANEQQAYFMGNSQLQHTVLERDLGVQVDWEPAIRELAAATVSKASQILTVIPRSFERINSVTILLLSKSRKATP